MKAVVISQARPHSLGAEAAVRRLAGWQVGGRSCGCEGCATTSSRHASEGRWVAAGRPAESAPILGRRLQLRRGLRPQSGPPETGPRCDEHPGRADVFYQAPTCTWYFWLRFCAVQGREVEGLPNVFSWSTETMSCLALWSGRASACALRHRPFPVKSRIQRNLRVYVKCFSVSTGKGWARIRQGCSLEWWFSRRHCIVKVAERA